MMENKLKPGEKGFSIVFLLFGLGALIESIKLFMKDPNSYSFGALPLFLSICIVICMLKIIFIENKRTQSKESNGLSFGQKVQEAFKYIFSKDIIVVLVLMIAYCIALYIGLGFEISTTAFLYISMCYLMGGQYLKNIPYTVLSMVFILVVFKAIFRIILP